MQNISKGFFDLSRVKHISRETHKGLCKRVRPQNGDILLCRIGTLGKPIIVDVDYEFSIFVSLGLLRPINRSLAEWIVNCLDSPMGLSLIHISKVHSLKSILAVDTALKLGAMARASVSEKNETEAFGE